MEAVGEAPACDPVGKEVMRAWRQAAPQDGASLYLRCQRGDEAAWAEVRALALAVARRRGKDIADDTEDIANAVVEKLLQPGALAEVRDPAAFKGYVAIVAVREVTDRLRHPWRRRRVVRGNEEDGSDDAIQHEPDADPTPHRIAESRQALAVFKAELARLSPLCQRVVLAYIEHILVNPRGSYETLTRALGAKRGTVSSQVTRCLDQLLANPKLKAALGVE